MGTDDPDDGKIDQKIFRSFRYLLYICNPFLKRERYMAVIGSIRKRSGLLIIIVGVALAAFVLGDFLNPRSGAGRGVTNVGEIYGEEIPIIQFNERVEENIEIQKRNQQKESLDAGEIFKVKDQTWNQIVQEIVLGHEYEKLGLKVTSDELYDLVQGEDPHPYIRQNFVDPETQQYDPELVRNYLKNLDQMDTEAKRRWLLFEKAIKDNQLMTKYKNLMSKAYFMPDTIAYVDYMNKKVNADVRLIGKRYSAIPDSLAEVTDKEVKEEYEDRKEAYKQDDPMTDINYVVFEVEPSAKDREEIREDVMDIYRDFQEAENIPMFVNAASDSRYDSAFFVKGELPPRIDSLMFNSEPGTFVEPYLENDAWHMAKLLDVQFRPYSMKFSPLLFSLAGATGASQEVTRSREEADELADSLYNVIRRNPGKLEELAIQFSDDPSAQQNSGDLGWFKDGAMVYQFNQAVLESREGEVTRAETMFGHHIIKVTGKKEPVKKVRVAIIDRNLVPSNQTHQEVYARASQFSGEATSVIAFDTIAENMGMNVRSATYLTPMSYSIAGLEYPRPIIQWSHMEGVDVGTVSPVFTLEDKYIVAIVTKIRDEGYTPFEDMEPSLRPLVRNEKKGDVAVEEMKDALDKTTDLYELATRLDSKVDTVNNLSFNSSNIGAGYGAEGEVLAKIFELEENMLSQPIKGNSAAFIVRVDALRYPPPTADHTSFKPQLINNFTSRVNGNQYLTALKEQANIEDNRAMFY